MTGFEKRDHLAIFLSKFSYNHFNGEHIILAQARPYNNQCSAFLVIRDTVIDMEF